MNLDEAVRIVKKAATIIPAGQGKFYSPYLFSILDSTNALKVSPNELTTRSIPQAQVDSNKITSGLEYLKKHYPDRVISRDTSPIANTIKSNQITTLNPPTYSTSSNTGQVDFYATPQNNGSNTSNPQTSEVSKRFEITHGRSRNSYDAQLREAKSLVRRYRLSGVTDNKIIRQALREAGYSDPVLMDQAIILTKPKPVNQPLNQPGTGEQQTPIQQQTPVQQTGNGQPVQTSQTSQTPVQQTGNGQPVQENGQIKGKDRGRGKDKGRGKPGSQSYSLGIDPNKTTSYEYNPKLQSNEPTRFDTPGPVNKSTYLNQEVPKPPKKTPPFIKALKHPGTTAALGAAGGVASGLLGAAGLYGASKIYNKLFGDSGGIRIVPG